MYISDDEHFKKFAITLENAIARFGEMGDRFDYQQQQIEKLLDLEAQFKKALIESFAGEEMYQRFVEFICDIQKNILDARPFFRERQEMFADHVSEALKARSPTMLYRFSINYQFVLFIKKQGLFDTHAGLAQLAKAIERQRQDIWVLNMPLAINRARVFFGRTPKSHLTRMDLIQISAVGLMAGIDKYTPEDGEVVTHFFRATSVRRMTGDLIENYSQTLVHFYPVDKRKIYRFNKYSGKVGLVDFEEASKAVNDGVEGAHRTNPDEIADLVAAASTVSADSTLPTDPDAPEPIERFAAPESTRPDRMYEEQETTELMTAAYRGLTVFEQKLLRLKGVRFN